MRPAAKSSTPIKARCDANGNVQTGASNGSAGAVEPQCGGASIGPKASRRQFLALTAGAVALTSVCPDAMAQTYPSRPITMVVAFGAGGPSDIIARILAEGMRGSLGQPVVIENVAGASGTIGVGRVARAAPDGYTLVLGNWATHVLNGPMFALQYDLEKDFEPVSLVSSDPLIIVARKTMPARDLKEFIAWLPLCSVAVSGNTRCVLLDVEKRQATSIPDDIRAAAACSHRGRQTDRSRALSWHRAAPHASSLARPP